jgi:hypothetical protein
MYLPSKRNKQKITKIAGSGSISQRHGSADPDPYQNVMDPQHCFELSYSDPRPASYVLEYGAQGGGGDLLDAVDVKAAGVLLDGRLAGGTALPVILVFLHPHLHTHTLVSNPEFLKNT